MSTVDLIHIEKHFDRVPAVIDLSLAIEEGELLVLVGPSGSGKSTVLRMIAGLEEPSGGEIQIDGRRVNEVSPRNRDLAMVFQSYALYPHMTVRQNLGFALKLRRLPKAEVAARVNEAAASLGIDMLLDRKPAALSGGQRQRVALGRALVRKPRVFLFDEPLSNLDAKLRNQTRAELASLHKRLSATMIYVTHDQVEAMTLGDRIAVMDQGRLMQVDRPLVLYERPANRFVAGFIGSPGMNWLEGEVDNGGVFRAGNLAFPLPPAIAASPAARGPVACGLRPEAMRLAVWSGDGTPTPGEPRLKGVLRLVERLGAETFFHVEVENAGAAKSQGGNPPLMIARLSGEPPAMFDSTDTPVELRFDPASAHYFAGASGARLG